MEPLALEEQDKLIDPEGLSAAAIYEAIDLDSNIFQVEDDGREITYLGREFKNSLYLIEEFVDEISRRKGEAGFQWSINSKGSEILQELPLSRYFRMMTALVAEWSDKKVYSAKVELFFEAAKELHLFEIPLSNKPHIYHMEGKSSADIFNELITLIYQRMQKRKFKKAIKDKEYSYRKNFRSACEYIDALFSLTSRLLVLRIDLEYRIPTTGDEYNFSLEEAQKDFKKFLNNKRSNGLFSTMKGYIWKMEFGREKGYHFHTFFFLDGAKSIKDGFIAQEIGNYWEKITDERGYFHNCNLNKQKYKRCGIGMISHDDTTMRDNLRTALKYLFKKDQFLREKYTSKTRSYGRGEAPKGASTKLGRPRKIRFSNSQQEAHALYRDQ